MKHFTSILNTFQASLLALAICFISISGLLSSCVSDTQKEDSGHSSTQSTVKSDSETSEIPENTQFEQTDSISEEIKTGYITDSSKPLPTQRIALKCYSFYPKGEKITVTASMGDIYTKNQEYKKNPSYDTYGNNGYPLFEVYPSEKADISKITDNDFAKINGEIGKYEHKFSKDDMQKLDISDVIDGDISGYYSEIVELDLSDCEVGESGPITFSFGWQYDTSPDISTGDSMWSGMRRTLGYYIAEDGVYLSFNGWEDAEHQSEKNNAQTTEIEVAIKK